MNRLSLEPLAKDQEADSTPLAQRATLVLTAWIATLLLSKLPLVVARDLLGTDIPWITGVWIGIAALLIAATFAWRALQPLRGFFIIMEVILVVGFGVDPLVRQTAVWTNLLAGQPQMVVLFAERVLLVMETLAVLAVLFLMGLKRRDAFLVVGDLSARLGGRTSYGGPASPTQKRKIGWNVLGPGLAILLGSLFFAFLGSQSASGLSNLSAAIPWLPLILLSAALNAFVEEATYRAAPLATLLPAVGGKHALWLTALWFGLGHYYGGIPAGPIGLVQTGLLALLLGKAMLDTRGMGWSWIIHVALDTVIYFFLAAG
jgi:membrane protease YdiL (CAAX protease family)